MAAAIEECPVRKLLCCELHYMVPVSSGHGTLIINRRKILCGLIWIQGKVTKTDFATTDVMELTDVTGAVKVTGISSAAGFKTLHVGQYCGLLGDYSTFDRNPSQPVLVAKKLLVYTSVSELEVQELENLWLHEVAEYHSIVQ